jgi:hypothetical protein
MSLLFNHQKKSKMSQLEQLKEKYEGKEAYIIAEQLFEVNSLKIGFTAIEKVIIEKVSIHFQRYVFDCRDRTTFYLDYTQIESMIYPTKESIPKGKLQSYDEYLKIKSLLEK